MRERIQGAYGGGCCESSFEEGISMLQSVKSGISSFVATGCGGLEEVVKRIGNACCELRD